jgi:hypothetical protein
VRALRQTTARRIEIYPAGCARFCRDECIAISVIAACQQEGCPALRACAQALTGTDAIEPMLTEARAYADCLLNAGQRLSPGLVGEVNAASAFAGELPSTTRATPR